MQEDIWAAGIICDKAKAASSIPHFQFAGAQFIFPFAFSPSKHKYREAVSRSAQPAERTGADCFVASRSLPPTIQHQAEARLRWTIRGQGNRQIP
jgi:hypothetical protein